MRELADAFTKAMWSMTTFGMQQMSGLAGMGGRSPDGRPPTAGMDDLSRAMECRMGEMLGEVFRTGDRLQRAMTDMMFHSAAGRGSGGDCGCSDARPMSPPPPTAGWGPMPPT